MIPQASHLGGIDADVGRVICKGSDADDPGVCRHEAVPKKKASVFMPEEALLQCLCYVFAELQELDWKHTEIERVCM
jgi:hypothetical protein